MRHIIIGQGPAGVIAAETLRSCDPQCQITLIGDEPERPYSRMALPYYLTGNINADGTHLRPDPQWFETRSIDLVGARVETVHNDHVIANTGRHDFDRLLIATGSSAIRPPVEGMDHPAVENCWTMADANAVAAKASKGAKVLLMGAGFIGCIVLEAMAKRGVDLTIVEAQDRMVPRMMDATGGNMIKAWCEAKGVRVLTSTLVERVGDGESGAARTQLSNGETNDYDLIVCAAGVKPNIGLLEGSGIKTDVGILVDDHLRTNIANIYAAGDVAQGPVFFGGDNEIHAIQPTASEHGRIAAMNMSGNEVSYGGSLSMNVLATLGLVSTSYGQWDGVPGGSEALMVDEERYRYIRLSFDSDVLVGALALGFPGHNGVLRGLIQTRVPLGSWHEALIENPTRVMEAYLAQTQGGVAMSQNAVAVP